MKTVPTALFLIFLSTLTISCGTNPANASPVGPLALRRPTPPTTPTPQVAEKDKIDKNHLSTAIGILEDQGADAAAAYAESLGYTPYNFGLRFSKLGSFANGYEWYNSLLVEYNDPEYLYGKAWVLWLMMETEKAYSDAEYIVTCQTAPPLIKARAYYLLGLIDRNNGEIDAGLSHAEKSGQLYKRLGKNGGLYLAFSLQARLTLLGAEGTTDDPGKKDKLITKPIKFMNKATLYNEKLSNPYNEGHLYNLKADIYFLDADYQNAILASQLAYDAYLAGGSDTNALYMKSQMGLFHALLGHANKAHALASEISRISIDKELNSLGLFNDITWCYMKRCKNIDYQGMKSEIIEWANSDKEGHRLLKLLSFVESVNCW